MELDQRDRALADLDGTLADIDEVGTALEVGRDDGPPVLATVGRFAPVVVPGRGDPVVAVDADAPAQARGPEPSEDRQGDHAGKAGR